MKTQKRCVVCRKVPKGANYLLTIVADYYTEPFLFRNVCRKCAVKIQEELIEDNIKRKKNDKTRAYVGITD
jgi:hypothetical protein